MRPDFTSALLPLLDDLDYTDLMILTFHSSDHQLLHTLWRFLLPLLSNLRGSASRRGVIQDVQQQESELCLRRGQSRRPQQHCQEV